MNALWTISRESLKALNRYNLPRMGAAIAFYTLFSMAPLLLIVITVASLGLEQDVVREQIASYATRLVGPDGGRTVSTAMRNASASFPSGPQAVIGVLVFFLGATAAFSSLLGALNHLWGVKSPPSSTIRRFVRRRLLAFVLVLAVAIVGVLSFLLNTVVTGLESHFPQVLVDLPWASRLTNTLLWLLPLTFLFAIIFRVVPDASLQWRDVLIGGAVTASLFSLGTILIGRYVGTAGIGSVFGAASSVVLTLVWVYWSAQIVLFGAVVTRTIDDFRHGRLRQTQIGGSG